MVPIRKYQKLKSDTWLVLYGLIRDALSGAMASASKMWIQSTCASRNTTTTMNTRFTNTPCTKSVMMTATWPPVNTKKIAVPRRMTIRRGKVPIARPAIEMESGSPM